MHGTFPKRVPELRSESAGGGIWTALGAPPRPVLVVVWEKPL
jgi:hypothetical protein